MAESENTKVGDQRWRASLYRMLASARKAFAAAPRPIRAALGGYSVVALFGLAYLVASAIWRGSGPAETGTIAALVAAPLALALLWPRLIGIQGFGLGLTLAQVTVDTHPELAPVIMKKTETAEMYESAVDPLAERIISLAVRPDMEILEVNLRDGEYWFPSRLFLLAALIQSQTAVRVFVFVEGGFDRFFVGTSSPAVIRRALAFAFPTFEHVYAKTVSSDFTTEPLEVVISRWPESFAEISKIGAEDQLARVGKDRLQAWLADVGERMARDSIAWTGVSDPRLKRSLIVEHDEQYVALLRDGKLDRMVNRLQLAVQLVARGEMT